MSAYVPPHTLPLPEVFTGLGAELRDLAKRLERVEAAMVKLTEASSLMAPEVTQELVTDLQALDLIQQSLVSLSEFNYGLSRSADSHAPIDVGSAARGVNLAELASRLVGRRREPPEDTASGEIEFF